MASKIAKSTCERHIHIPPNISQIIFIMVDKQPGEPFLNVTSLPNGHSAKIPNFRVCKPNGIPIMVIIRTKLAAKYSIAIKIPPKTSQKIFPINRILLVKCCYEVLK